MFEAPNQVRVANPVLQYEPPPLANVTEDTTDRRGMWSNIFNMFRSQTGSEIDVEAQVCRPVRNYSIQQPMPRVNVGATNKVFIERNQLLINGNWYYFIDHSCTFKSENVAIVGKCINSMDLMKQTETDCPESYFTFMKTGTKRFSINRTKLPISFLCFNQLGL